MMPTNEEIAIWLGWRYETETVDAEAGWYPPNEAYDENLPDWRNDPWRWAEVMEALPDDADIHFIDCSADNYYKGAPLVVELSVPGCRVFCDGTGTTRRLAFWAAFDAWWEAEKGE